MTDEEFEKLEHEYQLGYSKWGQKLKDAEKKWRKLHPPVYYAFEYPVPYLRREIFDIIFSDMSDEQKKIELERVLPSNQHYL